MNISFCYADGYNIVLGVLLMMFFYSSAGFLQTRSKENLYYSIYVISQWFFLFQLKDNILAHEPIQETWQLAMTRPFAIVFYNLFAIELLDLKRDHPKLYKYARWNVYIGITLGTIMLYFCILGEPETARGVIEKGKFLIFILGLFVVIGLLRYGSITSRYFVIGSFLLMSFESTNVILSLVCNTMKGPNAIRYLSPDSILAYPNFFTKIGITLDLLCLNLCLIYRNQQAVMRNLQAELDKQRALEAERSRIAKDMHDDLGSGLSALQMISSMTEKTEIPNVSAHFKNNLMRMATISADLSLRLREVIWTVSTDDDTVASLVSFVRRHAADVCESHSIVLRFTQPDTLPNAAISGNCRRNIFLAVKEILNNSTKYAQTNHIDFSVAIVENQLILTINDNGIGFDYTKALQNGGHGLRNIQSRMAQIGGSAAFVTTEKGTSVRLTVEVGKSRKLEVGNLKY